MFGIINSNRDLSLYYTYLGQVWVSRSLGQGLLPYWVKVDLEIERVVISILMHYIWTTLSGMPVSFCYVMIQQAGRCSCRVVASPPSSGSHFYQCVA